MTSDHADDDYRSSSSTATSHEEHTLYNFAMSFFSQYLISRTFGSTTKLKIIHLVSNVSKVQRGKLF
jgi:hypothetical protein